VIRGMTSVVNTLVAVTTTRRMPTANPTMRSGSLTSEPVAGRAGDVAITGGPRPVEPRGESRSGHPDGGTHDGPRRTADTLSLAFLLGRPPTCLFGRRVSPPPVTPES
jgi:hypothetical protein